MAVVPTSRPGNCGRALKMKREWSNTRLALDLFSTVQVVSLIFMVDLARAQSSHVRFPTDPWGHVYPKECQRDLSWLAKTLTVVREDLKAKKKGTGTGRQLGYWWHEFKTKQSTIYIDIRITDTATYDNVLQHELCHELMWRIRGDPKWHNE